MGNYDCPRCGYYVNPSGARTRDTQGRMYHTPGNCPPPPPPIDDGMEKPRQPVGIKLGIRKYCRMTVHGQCSGVQEPHQYGSKADYYIVCTCTCHAPKE